MDELAEHEAFLRAIFDAPDDDTPRLVYADFLDEHDAPDRAAFIRIGCELARLHEEDGQPRLATLKEELARIGERHEWAQKPSDRGFPVVDRIVLATAKLDDPIALRAAAVRDTPEWFGAKTLAIAPGRHLFPQHIDPLFALPWTQQVTEWDLQGHVEEIAAGPQTGDAGAFALIDMNVRPVISLSGVEALVNHRGARRIHALNLTHNNLDNDAARALVRSQYLVRLKRLDLYEGNRPSGKTWQQLIEKFGEDVVG
jgi:uncharacterized protein (TIGR02996 family)